MRYEVKGVVGLSGVERILIIDADSVKTAIASAKKQGIFPVLVTPLDESADLDPTFAPATSASASDTPSDRHRPLLLRCPACRQMFSETAEACPKCGHVIDEPTRGELRSAAMTDQQITKVVGIGFAVAFIIMFLMCCGGLFGGGGSDFHRARDIHQEYDNRMDRLGDLRDEIIKDPYTTDDEFRRRLDEIQAIPDDF